MEPLTIFQICFGIAFFGMVTIVLISFNSGTSKADINELAKRYPVLRKPDKTCGVLGRIDGIVLSGAFLVGWDEHGVYIRLNPIFNKGIVTTTCIPWSDLDLRYRFVNQDVWTDLIIKDFPDTHISFEIFIEKEVGIDDGPNAPFKTPKLIIISAGVWICLFILFVSTMFIFALFPNFYKKHDLGIIILGLFILNVTVFCVIAITSIISHKSAKEATVEYLAKKNKSTDISQREYI